MINPDLEAEYNNRAKVPEHPAIFARWTAAAAAFRAVANATSEIGIAYGPSARQQYDLFRPQLQRGDALVVFIHGGYWQGLDPSLFSHCARGLVESCVPVAIAGYDLCPEVTMAAIIDQLRACMATLWRRFQVPLVVAGHSAGGHLTACMLATDWPAFAPDLPPRIVRAGYPLSGLFDLVPLVETSINIKLGMDCDTARALSPLHWPAPAGLVLDAVVGGDEGLEYTRQSQSIAGVWALEGVTTRFESLPGVNHFTIVDPLSDAGSPMVQRIAALAGAGR
jgi:arylformamidase